MRILFLLISFFSYAEKPESLPKSIKDLDNIPESSDEKFKKQTSVLVLTKCGGASLLMKDEKGDFWDETANGFLRMAIFAELDAGLNDEEYAKIIDKASIKNKELIKAKRDEYSKLVRDIDPKDFVGEPPAYALLREDLDYCLLFTETELWKEVNFDL